MAHSPFPCMNPLVESPPVQPCKSWEIDCLVPGLKVIWFNLHLLSPQGCGFPGALHKVGQGIPRLGLTTMGAELAQNLRAPPLHPQTLCLIPLWDDTA